MKIFLCGDTGRLNRGCEAIVRGTVEVLGNKELYLATFAPEQNLPMVKELGVSMIPYSSYPTKLHRMYYGGIRRIFKRSLAGFDVIQKPLFNKMTQEDLCLNIGGDTYCYQRPAMSLALNNYTKKQKIENILWCCSIEKNKIAGEIFKDLKKYKYIFARETITVNNLIESGIPAEKVIKVCDPAFFLKTKEVPLPAGYQIGNTVGINLSDCVCYGPYKKSYDNVKYLIEWILKETDMSVCLIPHVYSISDENYHDWPILKRLHQEIGNERVSLVDKEYDCEQLKYIISKCRYFVGARTHSTIAAYSMKIPTLVIGYSVKSKGIAEDLFGTYENYVLPFEEMKKDDELLQAFKLLVKNEDEIRQRYEYVLPQYKQQLIDAINKYVVKKQTNKVSYICDQKQCSGCTACQNVCPTQAIHMSPNSQGFLYPQVNHLKCVNCGKCRDVCPALNKYLDEGKIPSAYAARNNNELIRAKSSSGGVFALIAEDVIKKGGVVFAPAFDSEFKIRHTMVDDLTHIPSLLGSKYVQSEIGESYKQVYELLENGQRVLFSGTPCQIIGLKSFLKKEYENLLTQDIICHGTPSPGSWEKYLQHRKNEARSGEIKQIHFREKQSDGSTSLKIEFSNGFVYKGNYIEDAFIKSYLSNLNLRDSCLDCSFKQIKRGSDITLGDFWGVEKCCPKMTDGKGVTLMLVHSEKGNEIVRDIANSITYCNVCFDNAIKDNASYSHSTKENPFRNDFLSKVTAKNFEKKVKKYSGVHFTARLRRALRKIL